MFLIPFMKDEKKEAFYASYEWCIILLAIVY